MALLIFANGVLDEVDWIRPYLAEATAVWAADGGTHHLYRLNHPPDRVIGDMDSLNPELLTWLTQNQVAFEQFPAEKDETDLELTFMLAAEHPESAIWLFGLLGGRLDQMLANIFLLTHPALMNKAVQIITPTERAWLVRKETTIYGQVGELVSLIPLVGDAHGVTAVGLQWPLQGETLRFGEARGVSNKLVAETATVSLESGLLLCVHSKI